MADLGSNTSSDSTVDSSSISAPKRLRSKLEARKRTRVILLRYQRVVLRKVDSNARLRSLRWVWSPIGPYQILNKWWKPLLKSQCNRLKAMSRSNMHLISQKSYCLSLLWRLQFLRRSRWKILVKVKQKTQLSKAKIKWWQLSKRCGTWRQSTWWS